MIITRRDFLKIANRVLLTLSGLLGLGVLARFLSYQTESSAPTEFNLGRAENYPLGSDIILSDIPAVLRHTEEGFFAMSLTCTHLGCTLEQDDKNLSCPCHGSRFDENGLVLQGPAKKDLPQLSVEIRDEDIIVHII